MDRDEGLERLTPADASNVVMDAGDQVNVFLLAGLLGRGGFVGADGVPDLEALRRSVAGRLRGAGLRRFGQRVRLVGRTPVWEPCEPELAWHVRAVEPVAGTDGLAALCAELMTTTLPLDRPLWELLVVPGAGPAGPGIVLRVHHAVADGVAGVRLVERLFSEAAASAEPGPNRAGPSPSTAPGASGTPAPARRAGRPRRRLAALAASVSRVTAVFRATVPPTVLLGPIGPHRGVAFTDVDVAPLAAGARAAGGTVNDALLAAVAGAAEAALRSAGEPVPEVLPASVPVALTERGASGNAVGVMLVPLPTGRRDPGDRLARIARLTVDAKAEARAQGTYELTRTRWGARLFAWLARRQRFIALFVTNVRGPGEPLLVAGAPLERAWPVAPIQGNVRLGVAALSYAGRLGCAVHVDADALPAPVLGHALAAEFDRIARSPRLP